MAQLSAVACQRIPSLPECYSRDVPADDSNLRFQGTSFSDVYLSRHEELSAISLSDVDDYLEAKRVAGCRPVESKKAKARLESGSGSQSMVKAGGTKLAQNGKRPPEPRSRETAISSRSSKARQESSKMRTRPR